MNEDKEYEEYLHKYKYGLSRFNCDCKQCYWQDQCEETLTEQERCDIEMNNFSCSDFDPIDLDDNISVDYIIERNRSEYIKEYFENYNEFIKEWN